jgi:hypothetical protein
MIAYVLYNLGSETERLATDLAKRLETEQVDVELIDADSPRGVQLVENYDIVGRPAVALIRDDGSPAQIWQGVDQMPSPPDVGYLAHQ